VVACLGIHQQSARNGKQALLTSWVLASCKKCSHYVYNTFYLDIHETSYSESGAGSTQDYRFPSV
jgi:hypothetical protein